MDKLTARIAQDGPISVEDYMAACLGDAEYGYYVTRDPLGVLGDFITAPEISQVFGELIGLWCAVTWQQMGEPTPVKLIELGPGRGTLMADMLRVSRQIPGFREAIEVHLVETSPALQCVQKDTLASDAGFMHWHDRLEDVSFGTSIIVANEFLDALPIRQFQKADERWYERCVGLAALGGLEFCLKEKPIDDLGLIPEALQKDGQNGDFAEICPAAGEIVRALAKRAEQSPTVALFIDYGHIESGTGETLQAVKDHNPASPLETPGEADLTAHVDFGEFARMARNADLMAHECMTQGAFLMSLGLKERVERLIAGAGNEASTEILSAAHRLADTSQMGDLFKVLAISSSGIALPPFDMAQK